MIVAGGGNIPLEYWLARYDDPSEAKLQHALYEMKRQDAHAGG